MKRSKWVSIATLLGCLIVLVVYIAGNTDISTKPNITILDSIIECYDAENQCGLHIIIEEGDLEDHSIEVVISWLEDNVYDLPEAERELGLVIARYLLNLNYEERLELEAKAFQLYIMRKMP